MADTKTLVLMDVELVFPSLHKEEQYKGVSTGKFGTKFSYDIGSANDKRVKVALKEIKGGAKIGAGSIFTKLAASVYDVEEYPQFDNKMVGKASSKFKPAIVDRKLDPMPIQWTAWSGDRANVEITLWKQKDDGRVNAWINSVQIVQEKPRGDSGTPKVSSTFAVVEDGEDFE